MLDDWRRVVLKGLQAAEHEIHGSLISGDCAVQLGQSYGQRLLAVFHDNMNNK